MKSSEPLIVKTRLSQKDDIIIHPNEGYDLGIMNTKNPVKIFGNTTIETFNNAADNFFEGHIVLENNCSQGTVELNSKYWKKIGSPDKIRLFYEADKILISNM